MIYLYIAIGIIVVLVAATIAVYNNLSKKKLRVENAFSQIKIQCKKRAELVPYLADVVKSYAKLETPTDSSAGTQYGGTHGELAEAESRIDRDIKLMYMLAEKTPGIKADANFLQLQTELVKLEKAIAVSRGFYNDAVMMYNRSARTFPKSLVAKMFRFKPQEFLDELETDNLSAIRGAKCPNCGAISNIPICPHCGTRIPLM